MGLLDRKLFREIYRSKFRSLLIIVIVAVTVGMITGMRGADPMIQATYEDNLIYNNVADGRFTFPKFFDESNSDTSTSFSTGTSTSSVRVSSELHLKEKGPENRDPFHI